MYVLTKVASLAFKVILAFLCKKSCITISENISVVHGGCLHYLSNVIGDNHAPSFSGTSFPSLVSSIIIPFHILFQDKTTPSPPFFHTVIHFILSSPVILFHTTYPYQCSPITIFLPYLAATGDSWVLPTILGRVEDRSGFPVCPSNSGRYSGFSLTS